MRLLERSLLILAALGAGVAVCEVALRVGGYSYPSFYRRDPVIGATLRPNAEGWWTREGGAYIRINSRGLRDREHELVKPPGTVRIAVLGDSFSEALQVPIDRTFWAIAESRLRDCHYRGQQDAEVINFGVSGFGQAQELLMLRDRVWDYDPDVVLLAASTRGDVSDNSRALRASDEVPYFTLANGQLVLDDSFRQLPWFLDQASPAGRSVKWIRDHSRVAQMAVFSGYLAARTWARGLDLDDGGGLANFRTPKDPVWQDAWAVTEALIGRIRDEVEARQKTLVVVTLSGSVQIDPDPAVRHAAMTKYSIDDFFYPDLRIRDFANREGIAVLTLAPPMQAYAESHRVQLHGFGATAGRGHWNETGHQVAGEMIADWLCATSRVSGS